MLTQWYIGKTPTAPSTTSTTSTLSTSTLSTFSTTSYDEIVDPPVPPSGGGLLSGGTMSIFKGPYWVIRNPFKTYD